MSRGTPYARFRLAAGIWERMGQEAERLGTDRAAVLRAFVLWWLRYPGAELPDRPAGHEGSAPGA